VDSLFAGQQKQLTIRSGGESLKNRREREGEQIERINDDTCHKLLVRGPANNEKQGNRKRTKSLVQDACRWRKMERRMYKRAKIVGHKLLLCFFV